MTRPVQVAAQRVDGGPGEGTEGGFAGREHGDVPCRVVQAEGPVVNLSQERRKVAAFRSDWT